MTILKKIIAGLLVFVSIPVSSTLALSNKESFLSSLNSLNTLVNQSISDREKSLSDRASDLGVRYDSEIKKLGYTLDEVEALTQIKKLNAPNFRRDVSDTYTTKKKDVFADIRTTSTSLSSLRDEVSLGYSDLSNAQKQSYDAKLAVYRNQYNSFISGSTSSLDTFTASFSGKLASVVSDINKMMKENGGYVRFIASLRSEIALLDANKAAFLSWNTLFESTILPKLQGDISAFSAEKKATTNLIRTNLEEWLNKALEQDRLKKQENELRAQLESIMSNWNEYLKSNFSEDEVLLLQSLESKNLLESDKALRSRIYGENGDIRSLDSSWTGLILEVKKLSTDFASSSAALKKLNTEYGSGTLLASIRSRFKDAYQAKLREYQSSLSALLQSRLNTALLSEVNHAQNLKLIEAEEKLLQTNLQGVVSYDFARNLVETFFAKLDAIARKDSGVDTALLIQKLKYRYERLALQKRIETDGFSPYFSSRLKLDASIDPFLVTYGSKFSSDVARIRLNGVVTKLDALLARDGIGTKKQYQLLVLKSNILKYLENASK